VPPRYISSLSLSLSTPPVACFSAALNSNVFFYNLRFLCSGVVFGKKREAGEEERGRRWRPLPSSEVVENHIQRLKE
jgi:hypothetical protein